MKTLLHSRIFEYFDMDTLIDLNRILYSDLNNVDRGAVIINLLTEKISKKGVDVLPLGSGTNRIGIQIEDSVFKIALDKHGCIDNRREFKYTDKLQPYVAKAYECLEDGLVCSFEPFNSFTYEDWTQPEVRNEVLKILKEVSRHFFIGDIGLNSNNYGNWGYRKTDKQIGILDFAYIYSVSYQTFACTCETRPFLKYDNTYVNLVCPVCGRSWSFGEIRKRISRDQQEKEIGNISELSYNVTSEYEEVEANPSYTLSLYNDELAGDEKKIRKREAKLRNRKIVKRMDKRKDPHDFNEFDVNDPTSFAELLTKVGTFDE